MTDEKIGRMNGMRDAGIPTAQIYMHFAEKSGGFEKMDGKSRVDFEVFSDVMARSGNNEAETDYYTSYGFPVMQTHVQALERSAASIYTREIFFLFQSLLLKASSVIIVD
ncbi:hypothetical protein PIB30_094004 [Stylosanthes scabra]|uniref:Uncharacterized protein n=1 Tax=Stylosanthes scabra TaxID=79078 RepID=A0ABU6VX46_9FABA|nr:hypothetical protein [Stylosanthes scabra]